MTYMSSDMPNVFTSIVEHFGSPGTVVFTAYDAYIHTIFIINWRAKLVYISGFEKPPPSFLASSPFPSRARGFEPKALC